MVSPIALRGENLKQKNEKLLIVENLSKRFGSFYALQNISLSIPEASIVLLIGPNGSGKTTLINCISGVYIPDEGKIWFNGQDITGKPPYEVAKIGIGRSFQIPEPFKKLTVAENLLLCSLNNPGESFLNSLNKNLWKKYEKSLIDKMFNILKVIGLESKADSLAEELSGGQLKLLELGRLLMLDSKMMLLDEPIGGINPVLANEILHHIKNIRDTFRTSFLIVEHRLDIVMKYVDYVHVLFRGNLVASGIPEDIVRRRELYDIYLI
ncbi:MAG: ABC transporter ATP-binding protein [Candidatus Methanomethylicaceae archaeon]